MKQITKYCISFCTMKVQLLTEKCPRLSLSWWPHLCFFLTNQVHSLSLFLEQFSCDDWTDWKVRNILQNFRENHWETVENSVCSITLITKKRKVKFSLQAKSLKSKPGGVSFCWTGIQYTNIQFNIQWKIHSSTSLFSANLPTGKR